MVPVTIVVGSLVVDHKWYPVGVQITPGGTRLPVWRVERRDGGVGRNVAENLGRLGVPVRFAGLSGTGAVAGRIERRLREAGVLLAPVRVPGGIGRFDVHLDEHGRLTKSRIRLPDAEALAWETLMRAVPELGGAGTVAVETGLSAAMLAALRKHTRQHGVRLCGLPTRLAEFGPRRHLLKDMDVLLLNEKEAAAITGIPAGDTAAARAQVTELTRSGPPTVVLTRGARGVVAASPDHPRPMCLPAPPATVVDDTGAGDALAAGVLAGVARQFDLATSIRLGLRAAATTVGCPDSTCRRIDGLRDQRPA